MVWRNGIKTLAIPGIQNLLTMSLSWRGRATFILDRDRASFDINGLISAIMASSGIYGLILASRASFDLNGLISAIMASSGLYGLIPASTATSGLYGLIPASTASSDPNDIIYAHQQLLPEVVAEYLGLVEEVLSKGLETRLEHRRCNKEEHPE
uniref:Uncharacterized protein n=1 Tax=Fagus sylvatica TaxID=28930 RepID=A0A2N9GMJ6_FAGSY